jgi:hypothetical protein
MLGVAIARRVYPSGSEGLEWNSAKNSCLKESSSHSPEKQLRSVFTADVLSGKTEVRTSPEECI